MRIFRDTSIRNKLTVISMLTCMIVLLLTLVTFIIIELAISRSALIGKISALAEVIGINSTAALTFNDQKSAATTLAALSAESEIISAAIYTKDGKRFAQYLGSHRETDALALKADLSPPFLSEDRLGFLISVKYNYSFHRDYLELYKAIVLDGETIGIVYLKSSLSELWERLKLYAGITILVLLIAMLIAYLLSSKLQDIISKPILYLAQAMKIVSEEKNYSIQVKKRGEDELGALMDGFNEMLAQIQKRDAELEQHRDRLEEEVARRTDELLQSNQDLERAIEEVNQTAQVLTQKERRLAYAQQIARLGYWEWLIGNDELIWSGEANLIFGLRPKEISMTRETFLHLIHPGDRELVERSINPALSAGKPFGIDHRIVLVGSSERIVHLQGEVIFDGAGNPLKMTGTVQDITERKRAEEALRESEEKYRALMNNASEGILLFDINGNLLEVNKKMEELLGYPKSELLKRSFREILQTDDPKKSSGAFAEIVMKGSGSLGNRWLLRKTGKKIPVEITASVVEYAGITVVQGIVKDISGRRRMEEERLLLSKMESLGLLAGGIAHDFNNILTAILGNISLATLEANLAEGGLNRLAEAEKACQRAQALAGQLLSFAKGGMPIKKITSLAELLKESAKLALSGSKARCVLSLPEDLWLVEVDEGQIGQVISNLLINADQAMPEGGRITVQAENVVVGENSSLQEEKYVKITIADKGIGIPPKYLGKIFDPYFTTKKKGSGLGLATAYSIVKNNAGYITVESEVGVGTTFFIYLPALEAEILLEKDVKLEQVMGQGRILVMDDEEMVRDVLGKMLKKIGYEVGFAGEGAEALESYRKAIDSGQPFAAVIFDLTVPGGMGGKEALEHLLTMDPRVKAIVSSGYSDDPVMSDFKRYGFSGVIAKPYRVLELSRVLHDVITKDI